MSDMLYGHNRNGKMSNSVRPISTKAGGSLSRQNQFGSGTTSPIHRSKKSLDTKSNLFKSFYQQPQNTKASQEDGEIFFDSGINSTQLLKAHSKSKTTFDDLDG